MSFDGNSDSLLRTVDPVAMKITDDYNAKQKLWARNPHVVPAPAAIRLPAFKSRRFSSHAEMNEWKRLMLLQLARQSAQR